MRHPTLHCFVYHLRNSTGFRKCAESQQTFRESPGVLETPESPSEICKVQPTSWKKKRLKTANPPVISKQGDINPTHFEDHTAGQGAGAKGARPPGLGKWSYHSVFLYCGILIAILYHRNWDHSWDHYSNWDHFRDHYWEYCGDHSYMNHLGVSPLLRMPVTTWMTSHL